MRRGLQWCITIIRRVGWNGGGVDTPDRERKAKRRNPEQKEGSARTGSRRVFTTPVTGTGQVRAQQWFRGVEDGGWEDLWWVGGG